MASRISICRSIEVILLTMSNMRLMAYLSQLEAIHIWPERAEAFEASSGLGPIVCLFFSNKISLARIAKPEYAEQIVRNISSETFRNSIKLSRPVHIIFHDIFIFVSSRTDV